MSEAGRAPDGDLLILALDGYEGPIDVLLALARDQKVDLTQISILALAEQYLAFVLDAHRRRIELAADYLVMAAWLAYLKSRLLLPDPPPDEEPSGEEMAATLQFRLARLAAMQEAGHGLLARPQLGREIFVRVAPEGLSDVVRPVVSLSLHEFLKAWAGLMTRGEAPVLQIPVPLFHSVDDALARLQRMIGDNLDWARLEEFLPPQLQQGIMGRSAMAATFVASLELARRGFIDLQQQRPFGPIFLRASETA